MDFSLYLEKVHEPDVRDNVDITRGNSGWLLQVVGVGRYSANSAAIDSR
jgi:hypothetical protein